MFEKIKALQQYYGRAENLRDIRVLGMIVFGVITLMITWSGAKAIESNFQLQKQITALSQQNELRNLENSNLKLQNQYYKSDQYLNLSARQNFGLAMPGETQVLVSREIAYRYAPVPDAAPRSTESNSAVAEPFYQKNIQAWVNFFLHRQGADGAIIDNNTSV